MIRGEHDNHLFEFMLLIPQNTVLCPERLGVQRGQPGPVFQALLHPLLQTNRTCANKVRSICALN